MRKSLKISALVMGLFAAALLLNNATKAADGTLALEITAGTGYCVYATDLDLGSTGFDYTARNREGDFTTTDGDDHWLCVDEQGQSDWTVTLQSTDVLNMTTSNAAHTIPATDVSVANGQATITAGVCTAGTYTNALGTDYLDSAQTLFGKASAAGEICTIETPGVVSLRAELAASQAIGVYSGTLTVTIPSF
ncbi:hypothetical protein K9M48_01720 [Candidatus Gracilibacteria bacterium]|nr:hypothetical protein [Candidatus Gracilibacteria bacterium]